MDICFKKLVPNSTEETIIIPPLGIIYASFQWIFFL